MKRLIKILLPVLMLACAVPVAVARGDFNDKILNRPYTDMRRWHLGFSIGMQTQNLAFTHNGYVTPEGEVWRMEQPDYQPGFCVNGLLALRLNDYFSVRFSPGMYFGSRDVRMTRLDTEGEESQSVKSTFVVLPVDLKFAGMRYRNARPYAVAGIMPAFDVSKKSSDLLKLNTSDFYISVGLGCDFYLPYFKLIPELKFCFGLTDVLMHDRPDLADDPGKLKFTQSLAKATSKMVVLTFYFE